MTDFTRPRHPYRSASPQFFLFLPQMRLGLDDVVARATAAEAAGFTGIAFMDHLAPPMAETQPMWEAMTLATWVAANTETLIVSHLVLCDSFRHPAVLARQAVTLDHASGGRFELGIGSGSVPDELDSYGIDHDGAGGRVTRLAETLDLLEQYWSGDPVKHEGRYFQVDNPGQVPVPLDRIPIVIGAAKPRMLDLVKQHATWWNLQITQLSLLEQLRPAVGDARVSLQHMVSFVPDEASRAEVEGLAMKRFGMMGDGLVLGDAVQLVEHFGELVDRGIERFYVWFADFAPVATLEGFGAGVIDALR